GRRQQQCGQRYGEDTCVHLAFPFHYNSVVHWWRRRSSPPACKKKLPARVRCEFDRGQTRSPLFLQLPAVRVAGHTLRNSFPAHHFSESGVDTAEWRRNRVPTTSLSDRIERK